MPEASTTVTVIKIKDTFAVCEKTDTTFEEIPLAELPAGVKENDILIFEGGQWHQETALEDARKKSSEDVIVDYLEHGL